MDELIASGVYPSEAEGVDAALDTRRDANNVLETWLREEVAPTYDLMKADPSRGVSAEAVAKAIAALHTERVAIGNA